MRLAALRRKSVICVRAYPSARASLPAAATCLWALCGVQSVLCPPLCTGLSLNDSVVSHAWRPFACGVRLSSIAIAVCSLTHHAHGHRLSSRLVRPLSPDFLVSWRPCGFGGGRRSPETYFGGGFGPICKHCSYYWWFVLAYFGCLPIGAVRPIFGGN